MRDNKVDLNQDERSMVGVVAASHPGETSPKLVMRRLLPTLVAIVIALLVVAGMTLYQQDRRQLSGQIAANISHLSGDLHLALEQQVSGFTMAAQLIVANATVQKALREGDVDRLLAEWLPVFETLHREKNLTHFYFFDANRVCLLRVHKPEKSGDRIERFTALECERTGKTASGIELGPLGTYILRVVQPVFQDGALVGYVELGKEIEDVLHSIKTHSGNQLAVVIRKMYLNRQNWEEGMRLLGREADWDRLPQSVVSYASQGRLPDSFLFLADHSADDHFPGETFQEIAFDGKDWGVSAIPLQDASGRGVGDLLILIDISIAKAAFARLIVLGGAVGIVLLAVLLSFIYVQLSRTDAAISIQKATIQEREESYRNQFYNNTVVMLLIDPENGAIIDANTAALSFYGYSRECMLAMCMTDINILAAPEGRDAIASVPQGGGKRFECQQRLADGSLRNVEVSTSRVHFGGRMVLNSTILDITGRKQAKDALKFSLSLLSASLESTADGILIVDTQGKIARWNQKFAEMWNIPKEVLLGRDDDKAINYILAQLADPESFAVRVRELYEQPELSSLDLIEFADGRFFERYSQPQKIEDTIVGRVWSFRDITERKQTEDVLRANRKQLTDVIEFLPDATFAIDKEGRIIIWNNAIEDMTGIPAVKMIGNGGYAYTKPFYGEARPMILTRPWKECSRCYGASLVRTSIWPGYPK